MYQDAAVMIDEAILTALREKKPVYLEIPVNLNSQKIATPSPLSFMLPPKVVVATFSFLIARSSISVVQFLAFTLYPLLFIG